MLLVISAFTFTRGSELQRRCTLGLTRQWKAARHATGYPDRACLRLLVHWPHPDTVATQRRSGSCEMASGTRSFSPRLLPPVAMSQVKLAQASNLFLI